jgi:hypothetical protein
MSLSTMGMTRDSLTLRHGDHAGDLRSNHHASLHSRLVLRCCVPVRRARTVRSLADPELLHRTKRASEGTPQRALGALSQVIRYGLPPRRGAATLLARSNHDARVAPPGRRVARPAITAFHRLLAPLWPRYRHRSRDEIAPRSRSASGLGDIHVVGRAPGLICRVMSLQRRTRIPEAPAPTLPRRWAAPSLEKSGNVIVFVENPTRRYL